MKKGIIAALLASFILLLLASGCTTEEEIPAASEQEYLDYHSTMIPVEEKLEINETGTIDMTRADGEVHFLP